MNEVRYGLHNMSNRLKHRGGYPQQDRMIKDKRKSLDRACAYSYQGAKVKKVDSTVIAPALINPNKLKPDYDDKVISIGSEYNFKTGTVFEWMNTDTKWLVYLQDLTELAYFRGDIRRCRYEISFLNEDGDVCTTYAAIRGPVETKINFIQKNGISLDVPNHSLNLLLPLTDDTLHYFRRYSKFYLLPKLDFDCDSKELQHEHYSFWRVEATDSISTAGILEITAVEYYENEFEDDSEAGLVGGLVVRPLKLDLKADLIVGEGFIKPKVTYKYTYTGDEQAEWEIEAKGAPIEQTIDGKTIKIKWLKTYSGQFVIKYGEIEKTVVVESLF